MPPSLLVWDENIGQNRFSGLAREIGVGEGKSSQFKSYRSQESENQKV